jgi:dimethylargininase
MEDCELTHQARRPIDLSLAEKQHAGYADALRQLGCELVCAPELPYHPDSVFVEDCAIVLDELAVITRPGAASRREEVFSIAETLEAYRRKLFYIEGPATLDGGDVLCIGQQVWVGLSQRTNPMALLQLQDILGPVGYKVQGVPLEQCLHLKSAVTQVGPDTVLLNPDWIDASFFSGYDMILVHPEEPTAANALLVGEDVLYPVDFPHTALRLAEAGLELLLVDTSEFIKAEGGVTCCSIVFND